LKSTLVNKGGQSPPFRGKECWASPKGVSLSAESDKGVALDLRAFEKGSSETFECLKEVR